MSQFSKSLQAWPSHAWLYWFVHRKPLHLVRKLHAALYMIVYCSCNQPQWMYGRWLTEKPSLIYLDPFFFYSRENYHKSVKSILRYCEWCGTNALVVMVLYWAGRSLCASWQKRNVETRTFCSHLPKSARLKPRLCQVDDVQHWLFSTCLLD